MLKKIISIIMILVLTIACIPVEQVKAAIDSNALIQVGTGSYQITVTQDTTINQISSKLGEPKLTTKSAFGGNAYTFYTDSNYSNYLYIETTAEGKIIAYGSVDPSYKTNRYSYNDDYDSRKYKISLAGCYYEKDNKILGGVYYNPYAIGTGNTSEIKKLFANNFKSNIPLYTKGLSKQSTLMYNAISAIDGNPANLSIDEELLDYSNDLISQGTSLREMCSYLSDDYYKKISTGNYYIELEGTTYYVLNPMVLASDYLSDEVKNLGDKNTAVFEYDPNTKNLAAIVVSEEFKNKVKSKQIAELTVNNEKITLESNILYAMSLLDDKMSDAEKAYILAQYTQEGNEYLLDSKRSQSYLGVLVDHEAVCAGYGEAYKLLLNRAGIPCEEITSIKGNHRWNICYLDGKWTYMDTTKGPVYKSLGETNHLNGFSTKSEISNEVTKSMYCFDDARSNNDIFQEYPEGESISTPAYKSRVYYDSQYKYYVLDIVASDDKDGLYRENRTTGEKTKIANVLLRHPKRGGAEANIVKNGSKIYFVGTDKKTIHSIKTDGTGEKVEFTLSNSNEEILNVYVSDGYMCYTKYDPTAENVTASIQSVKYFKLDDAPISGTYTVNDSKHQYNLKYVQNSRGTVIVQCIGIGNNIPQGEIYIPDEINGKPVIGIGESAFDNLAASLTGNLILPKNLEYIGEDSFASDDNIASIQFNDKLKSIGMLAFSSNKSITSIDLPDSLTYMEENAFYNCKSLTKVNIGKGLQNISSYVFDSCTNLETITFPETVKRISSKAITTSTGVKNIIIESTEIERMRFMVDESANIYLYGGTKTSEYADTYNIKYIDLRNLKPTITINQTSIIMNMGDAPVLLEYEVTPEIFKELPVTITSSNPNVAKVDNEGKITAVSRGTATITIKAGETTKECTVTVRVDTSNLKLQLDNYRYQINSLTDRPKLTATLSNGEIPNVAWTSTNTNVATVSNGVITPKRGGFTNIKAYDELDNLSAECWVYVCTLVKQSDGSSKYPGDLDGNGVINSTDAAIILDIGNKYPQTETDIAMADIDGNGIVNAIDASLVQDIGTSSIFTPGEYKPVTQVTLNKSNVTLNSKGQTISLTATYSPTDTTDSPKVRWTTSNQYIATVDSNGLVTAVAGGTATITAKIGNATASCQVTVTAPSIPLTSISLNKTDLKITQGNSETLTVTYNPTNTTDNKNVTWSSSDSSIVSVSNGTITAVAGGTATITATVGGKTATCIVTVTNPTISLTSISLNKTSFKIAQGNSETLTVTYNPTNTTDNKNVTWSSSDSSIVSVNNGTITAVAGGTATITATVGNKTVTCTVTVMAPIVVKPEDPDKPTPEKPKYTLGDVNNDGKINTLDAVKILQYVAKKTTLTETQMLAANVNRDNKVNTLDAVKILQYVAKKIMKF